MNYGMENHTFSIYAITCLALCGNLLFLWAYSGAERGRAKSSPNHEDVARFGGILAETEPAPIARILRAHSNAQAAIYPFLMLGLVFVLAGGSFWMATTLFGTFTIARILHSIMYLRALQPWRTLCFVIGGLATIALMLAIVWLLVRAP